MPALLDWGPHDQRIESERGYGLIAARVNDLHRVADEWQGSRRARTAFASPGSLAKSGCNNSGAVLRYDDNVR
jgi:hypothetical protein